MTIGILKSPDPRNRNSIVVINSKFLSVSSMNTLFGILKVTNARRDVILAGELNHRFPWRHHPPSFPLLPPPPLIYDEFHVPDVLIVLLYMWRLNSQGYWFKQKQSYELSMSDSRNYTWQLYKHIHVVQHICSTFACCCCSLSHKIDSTTTTLLWLIAYFHATILIVLSFTHRASIKAKLWLEQSPYRKRGANTFKKTVAEF